MPGIPVGRELKEAMGLMEHSADTMGPRCSHEWLVGCSEPSLTSSCSTPPYSNPLGAMRYRRDGLLCFKPDRYGEDAIVLPEQQSHNQKPGVSEYRSQIIHVGQMAMVSCLQQGRQRGWVGCINRERYNI